jgi:hypothetical protein
MVERDLSPTGSGGLCDVRAGSLWSGPLALGREQGTELKDLLRQVHSVTRECRHHCQILEETRGSIPPGTE